MKLTWLANGGHRLLFDLASDPDELDPVQEERSKDAEQLRVEGVTECLDGVGLRTFPYETWPLSRIHQFDLSRGVTGFGAG
ncbi:hypothetical protein [Nonomuraea insulae]|uniref:Uncharacterized protein n=1 Tax=Nonomuraea insulae TaxID=1616787 RepID=A0ABW1DCN0_9ACTN